VIPVCEKFIFAAFIALLLLCGCAGLEKINRNARNGDSDAQYELGVAYDFGHRVEQNRVEAAKWYLAAAEQGHGGAQNSLGSLYQHGEGVPRNYDAARKWYEKSAAQGNMTALNSLGYLYDFGLGVETNQQRATELYLKSAESGNAQAMLNLGVSYARGEGVVSNLVESYKWFDLALFYSLFPEFSRDRNLRAKSRWGLEQVSGKMSREEIADGKRRAKDWDREHSKHLYFR
jgi:uncharacterized protein